MTSLSFSAAFAIIFNVSMGSGFLIVPWMFNQLGNLAAICVMLLIMWISIVSAFQFLDLIARTQVLRQNKSTSQGTEPLLLNKEKAPTIESQTIEVSEILELNFGKKVKYIILIPTILASQFSCAGIISVFSSSFAQNVPIFGYETCNVYENPDLTGTCRWKYWIYEAIYVWVCMTLTIIGFKKQRFIQITTAVIRLFIVTCMFATSIAYMYGGYEIGTKSEFAEPSVNFHNLGLASVLFTFATAYQIMLPSIAPQMANKLQIPRMLIILNIVIYTVNIALGVVVGTALQGTNIASQCTLSWRDYGIQENREIWTIIIEYVVVLFPAFNVVFSLPLANIVFAANLAKLCGLSADSKLIRGLVYVLPALLAIFMHDLGELVSYSGIMTVAINFCLGPIGYIQSYRLLPTKTQLSGALSQIWIAIIFVVISVSVTLMTVLIHLPI